MLNYQLLRETPLKQQPFPFMLQRHSILAEYVDDITRDFPAIKSAGSFPVQELSGGPAFEKLLTELESAQFREIIQFKFDMNLETRPTAITARGQMRSKDGRVHTDSKSKLITVLMYFNQSWTQEGGQLRILRSESMDDYAEQVSPLVGSMVAFEVTNNCWHGHLPVVGPRMSLQLNYLQNDRAKNKHKIIHTLSARIKKKFSYEWAGKH